MVSGADTSEASTAVASTGIPALYSGAPAGALLWPESPDKYDRLMRRRGGVPFVFVGRRISTGEVTGLVLVNADVYDEHLWGKLEMEERKGFALPHLAAFNILRTREFHEVDATAILCFAVPRKGGAVLEESVTAELLAIRPAVTKYHRVSCVTVQESGIAMQQVLAKQAPFLAPSLVAEFLDWFVSSLSVPQDLVFVIHKPVLRPSLMN